MRRVLAVEAVANLAAGAAKLAVGTATGSAALLGDAVHSLTDLTNNGVALFAAHMAEAPPDREHHYGHAKIESMAVFALAIALVLLAVQVALRAGLEPAAVVSSGWGLLTVLGVLALQLAISTWETRWARRLDSDLLLADARHTLSDSLVTAAVLAGWQLAARGHLWADRAAAWAVSALVLYLAWCLFQRAVPTLVDRAWLDPDELRPLARSAHRARQQAAARASACAAPGSRTVTPRCRSAAAPAPQAGCPGWGAPPLGPRGSRAGATPAARGGARRAGADGGASGGADDARDARGLGFATA